MSIILSCRRRARSRSGAGGWSVIWSASWSDWKNCGKFSTKENEMIMHIVEETKVWYLEAESYNEEDGRICKPGYYYIDDGMVLCIEGPYDTKEDCAKAAKIFLKWIEETSKLEWEIANLRRKEQGLDQLEE
jgi:hypothetical protein